MIVTCEVYNNWEIISKEVEISDKFSIMLDEDFIADHWDKYLKLCKKLEKTLMKLPEIYSIGRNICITAVLKDDQFLMEQE